MRSEKRGGDGVFVVRAVRGVEHELHLLDVDVPRPNALDDGETQVAIFRGVDETSDEGRSIRKKTVHRSVERGPRDQMLKPSDD